MTTQPRLDWRSEHDPRSREFRALDGWVQAPLQDVLWEPGPVLNQGAEGACVGFATVGARGCEPVFGEATDDLARELYRVAQTLDEVPGEDYVGTSVLAGMKAAKDRGWVDEYRWLFGTGEVAQAVMRQAPVVIGVPWFRGMYDVGADGWVTIEGDQVGGHALVVVGFLLDRDGRGPTFVLLNSWGPAWGEDGLGYITAPDLDQLLSGVGEAVVPGWVLSPANNDTPQPALELDVPTVPSEQPSLGGAHSLASTLGPLDYGRC